MPREPKDWVNQSREKAPSPLGTSIFIGLRAADTVLQYSILQRGWGSQLIQTLGGSAVPFATPRDPALAYFGLGPYPAILSALALGSSTKHVAWILGISEQEMTPPAALMIGTFNTVLNTLNTMFSLWTITSAAPQMATQSASIKDVIMSSPTLMLGLGLYTVGIVTEFASEVDRKNFKDKPENKGKAYGGGLWSWATNINYGGYTLWRAGYAVSAAGLPWGLATGAFFFYHFATRGIPSLDKYCTDKVCFSAFMFDGLIANESGIVRRTVDRYQEACTLQALTLHLLGMMQEARPSSATVRSQITAEKWAHCAENTATPQLLYVNRLYIYSHPTLVLNPVIR